MTQLDSTEFKAVTAANFADNASGDISAGDLREQMDNIADSIGFLTNQGMSPTANDDGNNTSGNGTFQIGDVWVDTANLNAFVCVGNATSNALWATIGGFRNAIVPVTPNVGDVAFFNGANTLVGADGLRWVPGVLSTTAPTQVGIWNNTPLTDIALHVGGPSATANNTLLQVEAGSQYAAISITDTGGSSQILNNEGQMAFFVGGDAGTTALNSDEYLRLDHTSGRVTVLNSTLYVDSDPVWHAGNDGAGSTLDADLLDGEEGSYYLDYNNATNSPTQSHVIVGSDIDADLGGVQFITFTEDTTITATFTNGQKVILHLIDGDAHTITWPAITWIGGAEPTLTANCAVTIWRGESTYYGTYNGSFV